MLHAHSGLRWIALLLILIAIVNALIGKSQGKDFVKKDKLIGLFTLITFHTQLLLGLALYFTSGKVSFHSGFMKEPLFRFFAVEHTLGMLIAIALVTIGYSKSKKAESSKAKFGKIFTFYTIALIIVLASIPWPFRTELAAHWF